MDLRILRPVDMLSICVAGKIESNKLTAASFSRFIP